MPPKAKKYLITTETHEIFVVRAGSRPVRADCLECAREVEMLNLDAAVTSSKIPAFAIFRLIEDGRLHALETSAGHLLICRNSLKREEKE